MKTLTLIPLLFMPFLSHAEDRHGIEFSTGSYVGSGDYFFGFSGDISYRYADHLFGIHFFQIENLAFSDDHKVLKTYLITYGKTFYHQWWHINTFGGIGHQHKTTEVYENGYFCFLCDDDGSAKSYIKNEDGFSTMIKTQLIASYQHLGIGVEASAHLSQVESMFTLGLIANFNL